jgi:hypothetical protein
MVFIGNGELSGAVPSLGACTWLQWMSCRTKEEEGRHEKLGCWRAEIRWTWRLAGVGWASFLLLLFFPGIASYFLAAFF